MKNTFINRTKVKRVIVFGLVLVSTQFFSVNTFAQKRKPKVLPKPSAIKKTQVSKIKTSSITQPEVKQIDAIALRNLLKREGVGAKPLLVNFWATWCDPCREEFPELVEINGEYKDKIDFIVISLDDLAEIKRDVPKFLVEMKAKMPAYLLKTQDEEAAIGAVSKDWAGGLPFTILFNEKGEIVYNRQGKVEAEKLRGAIDKLLLNQTAKLAQR
ncbi:MAG: redoxin family protein [Acidobacteriota bacterium]|nr:redoxin family protein [Acidobacteriota bacterium]